MREKLSKKYAEWKKLIAPYTEPDVRKSAWQLVNSILPFFGMWYLMYLSLSVSIWLTVLLAIPAAGFMMRIFIIHHDCGHGSFFKSQKANDFFGVITGVLTLTPYYHWRYTHAVHHASAGDLDRRGLGDVKTWTVQEYLDAPWYMKLGYRIMRNPLFMFTIGAMFVFIIGHRIPYAGGKRERWGVIWTNLALAGVITLLSLLMGFWNYLTIHLLILFFTTGVGVWLFYVQHNFEGTYWERHGEWDYVNAGLEGSSFYKLPKILQWFSGNIGFHHIHHLSPRVPNYNLEKCHNDNPMFQVPPLTISSSLKSLRYRFWDEQQGKMVGYEALKLYRRQSAGNQN